MQIPESPATAVPPPAQPTGPASGPFVDTAIGPFDPAPMPQGTFVERMRTSFAEFAEVVPALIAELRKRN